MIPHSSAGVQAWGKPLRTVDNGPGRVDASQALNLADFRSEKQSTPVLSAHSAPPAVIDLTSSAGDTQEREPPAKRLKLDASAGSFPTDASLAATSGGVARNTPGIVAPAKPASLSWRGRPVWSFQALISEASDTTEEGSSSTPGSGRPASPPPFPHLPWKSLPIDQFGSNAMKPRDPTPAKKVQTTPFRVEIPSDAPVLKGDRVADFSPWTGNHPEDVLNDHSVKQGHYDRTQVSQNESNTARPSLYAQLKHRSGLQMLSSVFMAALEKRQSHNMVTAPSSFKPPPRVTLTDNKREAWLRDLANPSVPLRRLSRTIPHGIRGKALLDQCLNKWIPVSRAVWLAKCVGANEIRAFKRKGTSGTLALGLEAKWVREWTSGVQQFLEGVIGTCGSAEWKSKMTYAASLTARLFFERLLDYDQYFTWFLASLDSASLNMLPVWLLMLGIYWNSILRYRKRGRRLAELLLEKLQQIKDIRRPLLFQPLVDRLSCCIRKLVLEHTSSLILPSSWDTYKDLIRSCLHMKETADKAIFDALAERNVRVQLPKSRPESTQQSAQQRALHLFDSIHSSHDFPSTSMACLNSVEDKPALVAKLLEWSATPFRSGLCRIYTAARLLRKWKMSGVDIDSYIIMFLSNVEDTAQLNMDNVYHVISELVRSQTFSISKYLQWLMAKGVTKASRANNGEVMSSDVSLLTQLPMGRHPEHIRNLRQTLLSRAGLSLTDERSAIESWKSSISQRLPNIFPVKYSNAVPTSLSKLNPTWAVKSEVSMWVRQGVAKHTRDTARKIGGSSLSIDSRVSALTAGEFYCIREVLEDFGDLSILADVLKQATGCEDNMVLASATDTINYHFDAFCVIGATSDLFRGLIGSYARLKRYGTLNLEFVFSLIELGLRIPDESSTVALLRQDLARIESKSALAAPSPLSDHLPAAFCDVDASFQDKLDQLLSSGNGIDESSMATVFKSLTKILEYGSNLAKLSANDACRYLAYLRPFNPKYFDLMLVRWVCGLLRSTSRPVMSRILPPLIGVGCVTIQSFVSLVKKLLTSEKASPGIPELASLRLDLLQLLAPQEESNTDLVSYRFRMARQEFMIKYPEATLNIIDDAVPLLDFKLQGSNTGPLRGDLTECAATLLRTLLLQNSSLVTGYCMQKLTHHSQFTTVLEKAVDLLLGFDLQHRETESRSQARKVILVNNDFSLPFCQLKLQLLFNAKAGDEVRNNIVDVMFKAAVEDSRSKRSHWLGLVNLMSHDAARQIREQAENSFFSVPLFDEAGDASSASTATSSTNSIDNAKLYLTIIEKLAFSIPEAGVPSVVPHLVERFDLLLQKLIIMQTNLHSFSENRHGMSSGPAVMSRFNFERSLAFWFSALLRMTVLHRAAFTAQTSLAPKTGSLQEQTRLLVSIFCISLARLPDNILRLFPTANYFPHSAQPQNFRPCPGILLQTHALDVAASLIDSFPDEARHQCARFLKEKCPPFLQFQNDRRFLYLLGPVADGTTANPQLPASVSSPAAGGSTPTPTPSANLTGAPVNQSQPVAASASHFPGLSENVSSAADRLRIQHRGRIIGPYPVRPWELLEDAAPIMGVNDTAVSLKLFDTRRIRA
ncbi:Putative Mediator of RNA polymerase II transcription subunit 12 [Aspergillus calidoustus]|uniref:Mediator of RNA polymerase II transcription subunit 12 n=1 Tax=Aspergillus calidoustus TaxID=454130 RepID=A0A0U5GDF2_ASPCI|nr:Putative Mediator of RNA polymerase II transcription subunit 12 [Aspergillus calidoustus]